MKIAFFSECYAPVTNGVVTSLTTLRSALIKRGHTVYLFAAGQPHPSDDELVFRLPDLPFPRHPYHWARPFSRPDIDFRELNVDLIHCHHPFTVGKLGAELAKRHKLPMVYTAHTLYDDMIELSRSQLVRKVGPKAMRNHVRRFCARADCVIVPSNHTRTALTEDGVFANFEVIPSGVAPMSAPADARIRLRSMIHMDDAAPLLLQVSRLGPEKRVDLLIRAVALLTKRNLPPEIAEFKVAIVGDGQRRHRLQELAAELHVEDRIYFAGEQPFNSIGAWYAAADIFVLSSPEETQGLTIVEAMAAGLPCVAVAHGGPRELVVDHETGRLTAFSHEAFADAIESLLRDAPLRYRMGQRGLERAGLYTPDTMAEGVLRVYKQVLAQHCSAI